MNKKISEFPRIPALQDGYLVPAVRDGVNFVCDTASLKSYLTKTDMGLSAVDNTSDINKPISTATQTAISGLSAILFNKTDVGHLHSTSDISGLTNMFSGYSRTNHTHTVADITDLVLPNMSLYATVQDVLARTTEARVLQLITQNTTGAVDLGPTNVRIDNAIIRITGAEANVVQNQITANTHSVQISSVSNRVDVLEATGLDTADLQTINNQFTVLTNSLSAKASIAHTHTTSQITDFAATVGNLIASVVNVNAINADLNGIHADLLAIYTSLDGKAATTHIHAISSITGLQAALDAKSGITHVHDFNGVTGLQTALDSKAPTGHIHTEYAPTAHNHTVTNVVGLQTALDSKTDIVHTHTTANIIGLDTTLANLAAQIAAGGGSGGSGAVTSIDVVGTAGRITSSGGPVTSAGSITLDLDTTGVTAGSYTSSDLTVDEYGRITAIANGSGGGGNNGVVPTDNFGLGTNALNSITSGSGNTALGLDTLVFTTTGQINTAVGRYSSQLNETGWRNTSVGAESLRENIGGNDNTAIGTTALQFNIADNNTAVGSAALQSNNDGNNNTAVGFNALTTNSSGEFNVALGVSTLGNNTFGNNNVAIGYQSLKFNTLGYDNTAIGGTSLLNNLEGNGNTALGSEALSRNNYGNNNTALGAAGLLFNTSGLGNTATGVSALRANTIGSNNTGSGGESLRYNVSGNYNSGFGYTSLRSNSTGSNNTALGYRANFAGNYENTTAVGANSSITGNDQVQLGDSVTTTYVYGTVQNRSDLRDKADIRDTLLGLDFINSLRPVDYKWDMREDYKSEMPVKPELPTEATDEEIKASDDAHKAAVAAYIEANKLSNLTNDGSKKRSRYHHGFIAQEVQQVIDATGTDFGGFQNHAASGGDDVLSIGYDEFIAPLVRAVQELTLEKAELKNTLDSTVELLKSALLRIEALENK